jgi:hypothetical protein
MIYLNFSDKTKPAAVTPRRDPIEVFRNSLEQQIDACKLAQSGETFQLKRRRYIGGKEHHINVPLRPWWWASDGVYHITMRYSSQRVEVQGHSSVIAGKTLNDVLQVLTAVLSGLNEQDPDIVKAINIAFEKTRWKKKRPRD